MEIEGEKTRIQRGVLISNEMIIERLNSYISTKLSKNKPRNLSHVDVDISRTWSNNIICVSIVFYHWYPAYYGNNDLPNLPPNSIKIRGNNIYGIPAPMCKFGVDISNSYDTFRFYRRMRPNRRFSDSCYYKWTKFYEEFLFGEYAPVNNKSYYTKQPRESWK